MSKCCYLYRRRSFNLSSNPNNSKLGIDRKELKYLNVNVEAKAKVEMQTPVDDASIFTEVFITAQGLD